MNQKQSPHETNQPGGESSLSDHSGELVNVNPKSIFEKEFPESYSNGRFIQRISYVDFIDQALDRFDELGLNRNLEAYKELMRVFPPEKYHPLGNWDRGVHNAPQQLAAVRILVKLQMNRLKPDAELERIVVSAFSKRSEVWKLVARGLYWSMKFRNTDENPVPDILPKEPHKLAEIGLKRMLKDKKSVISISNTSSLPDVVDRTWIVHAQSPSQQALIEKLDSNSILYIENAGLTYVHDKFLSYFTLKVYDDEETVKRRLKAPEPDFNFNTVKMKFYGKPISEKLEELDSHHFVGDGHILAIAMTGTSSHDSVLSWLKILQNRNPRLRNLNVLFRLERPSTDIVDPSKEKASRGTLRMRRDAES